MQPKVARTTEEQAKLKPIQSCGDVSHIPSSQNVKHKNKGNDSTLAGYTG